MLAVTHSPTEMQRIEAFSDAVIAIIMTVMVLELRPPSGFDVSALGHLVPVFAGYVLSFAFLAIYWNNHHHLLKAAKRADGAVMWANAHLLFWLTLVPFVTAWMGEHHAASVPVALYGVVLFLAACAYFILQGVIVRQHGRGSVLDRSIKSDVKGKTSLIAYAFAVGVSPFVPALSQLTYLAVALMWIIPDRRLLAK